MVGRVKAPAVGAGAYDWPNRRSLSRIVDDPLDGELYALRQRLGEDAYPKTAKAYLDDWATPASGGRASTTRPVPTNRT